MRDTGELTVRWVMTPEEHRGISAHRAAMPPNAVRTVFLTDGWLSNWMDGYGVRDLRALTVWDGDRLVAELPLFERHGPGRARVWAIAGSGELTPNHLDIIGAPLDAMRAVPDMIGALLDASDAWDVLDLDKLDGGGVLAPFFKEAFESLGYRVDAAGVAVCPYADLPPSFEEYIRSRSKTTRNHAGQALRKLQREHPSVEFGVAGTESAVDRTMDALMRLHQVRWRARGHAGAFATRTFVDFHKKTAMDAFRDGHLRLYSLTVDGEPAAVSYCYRVGDRIEAYQTGFSEAWAGYRPGILLLAHTIEQSIGEGITRFDHLEGQETYKASWCSGRAEDVRLRVYNRNARGTMAQMRSHAVDAGIAFARRNVPANVREAFLKRRERLRVALRQGHTA